MDVGSKIYQLRKASGLTQVQLGEKAGVSEAAIRSYETGARKPKQEHLERIAKALGVRHEALHDYGLETPTQAIQSLFWLEDGPNRLRPVVVEGSVYLKAESGTLAEALAEWEKKREALDAGEITATEYQAWKDGYQAGIIVEVANGRVEN